MKTYNNIFGQAIDQLMNQSISDVLGVDFHSGKPAVNIKEEKDKHILELAVPGIPKESIDITIDGNYIVIGTISKTSEGDSSTNSESSRQEDGKSYSRKEFDFQDFERRFQLPLSADRTKISASYNSGILTIELAKKEEAIDNGPISIKVN